MHKIIKNLISQYHIDDIEIALIAFYLQWNKLEPTGLLKDSPNKSILEYIQVHIPPMQSIYDLLKAFELLIPQQDRKLNGAFFTPRHITEQMISLDAYDNPKILDPSCGCGAFLITSLLHLKKNKGIPIRDGIENHIYGIDIAGYNIRRCQILLKILCLENNENIDGIKFNLFHHDSLNKEFIKDFYGQFDIVIGNPPYVQIQDLEESVRVSLNQEWETVNGGNFNLYFAFFEIGFKCLNSDGYLSYITPNSYFNTKASESLRKFLMKDNKVSHIIDFGHHKIFDVQTYTCITRLDKKPKDFLYYAKIEKPDNIRWDEKEHAVSFDGLNAKKWLLVNGDNKNFINKVQSMPFKLRDIADIHVGITTGTNHLYTVANNLHSDLLFKEYNSTLYPIEREITRNITKVPKLGRCEKIISFDETIIFPYKMIDGKAEVYSEQEFSENFPFCYRYLLAIKGQLQARDKGKKEYPEWFAYSRTQSLNHKGIKLLTAAYSQTPNFILDNCQDSLFYNGYGIFPKNNCPLSIEILQKILNSQIMDNYIRFTGISIQGGYYGYQKMFIENFGIPQLSDREIKELENLENQEEINRFLKERY